MPHSKTFVPSLAACLLALTLPLGMSSASAGEAKSDPKAAMQIVQKQLALMTPELQQKVKALSPEIKQFLAHVAAKHTRKSESATLAQVMQEVMGDYQAMALAISMDNGEAAAEAARRLADHRLPRGGLLPYMPLDKVNTQDLSVLPAMEMAVEGGSILLAEAAEKGDMISAAGHLGDVTRGCVACHQHFRGQPGTSNLLRK
jgi:hypothetical protein